MKIIFAKTKQLIAVAIAASSIMSHVNGQQFTQAEWKALKPLERSKCGELEMGVNININSYSSTHPFVDFFKLNDGWSSTSGQYQLDENGYVTNGVRVTTLIDFTGVPNNMEFKLMWDGAPADVKVNPMQIAGASLKAGTFTQTASGGSVIVNNISTKVYLTVTNNQLAPNHIKNIRLIRVGHENTYLSKPFNPEFLEQLSSYKVVKVNDAFSDFVSEKQATFWTDRTKKEYYSQTASTKMTSKNTNDYYVDIAYEYIIDMANETGKDIWVHIPYCANHNYVYEMAKLFKSKLKPNIKVYLQTGYEIWDFGSGNKSFYYFQKLGNNDLKIMSDSIINRVKRDWKIWKDVFDTSSSQLNRVLGVQLGYASYLEPSSVVSYLSPFNYGGEYEVIAGSLSGYYMGEDDSQIKTPEDFNKSILETFAQGINESDLNFRSGIKGYSKAARLLNKKLMLYSGGYDPYIFNRRIDAQIPLIASMHKETLEPIMKAMYDTLRNYGFSLINHFSLSSSYGASASQLGATFNPSAARSINFNGTTYELREDTKQMIMEEYISTRCGEFPTSNESSQIESATTTIFPNPTSGEISIVNASLQTGTAVVECYNSIGNKVFAGNLEFNRAVDVLSNQPSGIYQFVTTINGSKQITKVIKQ